MTPILNSDKVYRAFACKLDVYVHFLNYVEHIYSPVILITPLDHLHRVKK